MGVVEGQATAALIDAAFANYNASNAWLENAHLPPTLQNFINAQRAWMDAQVREPGMTNNIRKGST